MRKIREGEKIWSTPIREEVKFSWRKLNSGCNYAFLMHTPIFNFLSVKMWTRQEENKIWLPNLQYRGWTRNGRKFIRVSNSLTEWNFQIFFYWWIHILIVHSSRKMGFCNSRNNGRRREKLILIARFSLGFSSKKLKCLNLFSYHISKFIKINTRMKRFYSLHISSIFSKCVSLSIMAKLILPAI